MSEVEKIIARLERMVGESEDHAAELSRALTSRMRLRGARADAAILGAGDIIMRVFGVKTGVEHLGSEAGGHNGRGGR